MKHKQYENWILDETPLTAAQQQALKAHFQVCSSCRTIQSGWVASKKLIAQSPQHSPASGFINRWQKTARIKCQVEKVRRYRLTMLGLIVLAFIGLVIYMLVSGSFMQLFTNGLTMISDFIMGLTNGLSSVGYWLGRLPIAVPLTVGFLFFGLMNAFILAGIFFIWNIKQRNLLANEIKVG